MNLYQKNKKILGIIIFFSLIFSSIAQAKLFKNNYLSFELPANWQCKQEGAEWLCTNVFERKLKEAIIILTAKEQSPADSLIAYEAHLKGEKLLPDKKGKFIKSKVINVSRRKVGGQVWVDGMHLGSEVSSFYTRYVATVKNKLAILVTFSAHKEHYTKYARAFLRAIQTLNVIVTPDLLNRPGVAIGPRNGDLMNLNSSVLDGIEELPSEEDNTGVWSDENKKIFGVVLLLLLSSGVLFFRKKKRK